MSRTRTEGSSTVFPAAWRDDDFWVGPGPRFSISGVGTRSQALRDSAFWIGRELFRSGSRLLAACSVAGTPEPDSVADKSFSVSQALLSRALPEGGTVIVANALIGAAHGGGRGVKEGRPSASTVSLSNANFSGLG
jgi:hypothetical protein